MTKTEKVIRIIVMVLIIVAGIFIMIKAIQTEGDLYARDKKPIIIKDLTDINKSYKVRQILEAEKKLNAKIVD